MKGWFHDVCRTGYYAWEDLRDGNVLARNAVLKNRHAGERCYVLGTGGSLKQLDLRQLRGTYSFVSNLLFKHPDFAVMQPAFFANVPPLRVMAGKPPEIQPENFYGGLDAAARGWRMAMFVHASCRPFIERRGLLREHDVFYVKPSGRLDRARNLSADLTRRVPFMDGVVYFMVACACYMGFSEIVLLGCGYTFYPMSSGHFYDDWELSEDREVDGRHRRLRDFAASQGVRILNVVPSGFQSPVYEILSAEDLARQLAASKPRDTAVTGPLRSPALPGAHASR